MWGTKEWEEHTVLLEMKEVVAYINKQGGRSPPPVGAVSDQAWEVSLLGPGTVGHLHSEEKFHCCGPAQQEGPGHQDGVVPKPGGSKESAESVAGPHNRPVRDSHNATLLLYCSPIPDQREGNARCLPTSMGHYGFVHLSSVQPTTKDIKLYQSQGLWMTLVVPLWP